MSTTFLSENKIHIVSSLRKFPFIKFENVFLFALFSSVKRVSTIFLYGQRDRSSLRNRRTLVREIFNPLDNFRVEILFSIQTIFHFLNRFFQPDNSWTTRWCGQLDRVDFPNHFAPSLHRTFRTPISCL